MLTQAKQTKLSWTRAAKRGVSVLYMSMWIPQPFLSFCFIIISYSLDTTQILKNGKFMSDSINIQFFLLGKCSSCLLVLIKFKCQIIWTRLLAWLPLCKGTGWPWDITKSFLCFWAIGPRPLITHSKCLISKSNQSKLSRKSPQE
jgi:hypothetical protein